MRKIEFEEWAPDDVRCLLSRKGGKILIKCLGCGKRRTTKGRQSLIKQLTEGKDIKYCIRCKTELCLNVRKVTTEMADEIGVLLDQKYQNIDGNTWVGRFCIQCNQFKQVRVSVLTHAYDTKQKASQRCKECAFPGWTITSNGYKQIRSTEHPMSTKDGYVLEHRLVMEEMLGRYLYPFETVHHKDGNRLNNDPSNLQLRTGNHGAGVSLGCGDCGSTNIEYIDLL